MERIVVERANDDLWVRKTLKTLVWSAQNRLISSKICLENNHKIGRFLPIAFWWSLLWKLLRNYGEIGRFFREFVPKHPAKFDFFFQDLSEALFIPLDSNNSLSIISPLSSHTVIHLLDLTTEEGLATLSVMKKG